MVRVGQISIDLIANTGQLLKPLRAAQRQVETFGAAIRHGLGGAIGGLQAVNQGLIDGQWPVPPAFG